MKNHGLGMIIGCLLPLFLIFMLPAFGVSGNVTLFIFIILMFGCHLLMAGGHQHGQDSESGHKDGHQHGKTNTDNSREEAKHEHH